MTAPCMRILSRTGLSCPALSSPSRLLTKVRRSNGVRPGLSNENIRRSAVRSFMTFIHKPCDPSGESPIPELRDTLVSAIRKNPDISKKRYLILLTTPAFSHLVSDASILRDIMKRTVEGSEFRMSRIHVAAAVVDALPTSNFEPTVEGWTAIVTDRKMEFYGNASEHYLNFACQPAPLPLMPESTLPRFDSRDPETDRGELQLVFNIVDFDGGEKVVKNVAGGDRVRMHLKMKLANTIFQNGRVATTSVYRFRVYSQPGGGDARIVEEFRMEPKELTIFLSAALVWEARVKYRMRRLTQPRQIFEANGNILKSVLVGHKEQPASRELEEAVTKLGEQIPAFDPKTLEKRSVDIYARIAKSDKDYLGKRIPGPETRFVKVLSGGGGWGQNAGILALDPDGIEGFRVPGADLKEVKAAGPALQAGKWVTFFASDPKKSGIRNTRSDESKGQWVFEVLPKDQEKVVPGAYLLKAIGQENEEASSAGTADVATANGSSDGHPRQFVKTGIQGGFWIDGRKLDVPGLSVLLDLMLEERDGAGPAPIRFVGLSQQGVRKANKQRKFTNAKPGDHFSMMDPKLKSGDGDYLTELELRKLSFEGEEGEEVDWEQLDVGRERKSGAFRLSQDESEDDYRRELQRLQEAQAYPERGRRR